MVPFPFNLVIHVPPDNLNKTIRHACGTLATSHPKPTPQVVTPKTTRIKLIDFLTIAETPGRFSYCPNLRPRHIDFLTIAETHARFSYCPNLRPRHQHIAIDKSDKFDHCIKLLAFPNHGWDP